MITFLFVLASPFMLLLSGVGLSNWRHRRLGDSMFSPLPLRAVDFLIAAVIFFGLPHGLQWLWGSAFSEQSFVDDWLSVLLGAFGSWIYLRTRAGKVEPPQSVRPAPEVSTIFKIYLVAWPGFYVIWKFNAWLVPLFTGGEPVQDVAVELALASGWERFLGLFFAVLLHPILEEVLFRGYLWRYFATRSDYGPRRALMVSAVIFAICHPIEIWLPAMYLGLLFGWVYWRTGQLHQAIYAHVLHNLLAAVLILLA